ncbi:diguanylate cyclase [Leptolyngbya sp. KIOST-1]|uniref:sensor domain-containing diguanylate cyclase n=1 Tax=Leptolyngbya sp. KIOST-1 TaxID=1229172 RepID=UPI000691FD7E|nr:diguanylate cyclase [Leptolyngbya sp. KIOST-1]
MPPLPHQVASWLSRGEACLARGDFAQALAAFEYALSLAQLSCNPQAEVLALQRLGSAHLEQGQLSLSVASIQQAIAIALDQHSLHDLYECHRQLAQTYKSMHSFELALQHLETAEHLRDSLDLPAPKAQEIGRSSPIPDGSRGLEPNDPVLLLFRSIVEQANVGVAIFQRRYLVYANPRLMQWMGYTEPDLHQLTLADLVTLDADLDLATLGITATGPQEGRLVGKTGQSMEVEIYATALEIGESQRPPADQASPRLGAEAGLEPGDRQVLVAFLRDLTDTQRVVEQLRASESRYRSLIHNVPIGLCRFSREGQPLDANPALLHLFEFESVAEFVRDCPIQPSSPVAGLGQPMLWRDYLQQAGTLKNCELRLLRSDGRDLWVRVIARAVREASPGGIGDAAGAIQYYEGAVEDITEIKAAQTALEELAMRDSLTHVYNRRHFIELASQELARSARFHRPVTLLMIDIDYFKAINDTYGHLAGDRVLRDIALRLKGNLRQSDILARYGGEEFILLMPETDQAQAWVGAERLRQVIAATPFDSGSGPLAVTASVGISCWFARAEPNGMPSLPHIDDLISKADQALYRAKQSGRNQTQAETWLHNVSSPIA